MLGLRSVFKEDIKATAAEMVYGQILRLPSDFFIEQPTAGNETEFVERLRKTMRNIRPSQTTHHSVDKPFIQKDQMNAENVFVRDDTILAPLQQPYDGPFSVIKRTPKAFKVIVKGKTKYITVDRLKPAFTEMDHNRNEAEIRAQLNNNGQQKQSQEEDPMEQTSPSVPDNTTSPRTTRSGRRVHFPKRLDW